MHNLIFITKLIIKNYIQSLKKCIISVVFPGRAVLFFFKSDMKGSGLEASYDMQIGMRNAHI